MMATRLTLCELYPERSEEPALSFSKNRWVRNRFLALFAPNRNDRSRPPQSQSRSSWRHRDASGNHCWSRGARRHRLPALFSMCRCERQPIKTFTTGKWGRQLRLQAISPLLLAATHLELDCACQPPVRPRDGHLLLR